MSQRKHHSVLEAALGTLIGFFISLGLGYLLYPRFDMKSHSGIMIVTLLFTLASVVRSYYVRRFFNWLHLKGII